MVTLDQGGRAADAVALSPVPTELQPWVEQVSIVDFRGTEVADWKVLPDTCGHLLVHLPAADSRKPAIHVVGSRTRAITTDVTERAWTVAVRFRPGALAALSRESATAFTDRSAQPDAVWGKRGARLTESVVACREPEGVRRLLLSALLEFAHGASPVDWRVEGFSTLMHAAGGRTPVSDVARRLGLAPRTLRAAAQTGLGLSPKRYARVERLFSALRPDRPATWAETAARSGYADQPHFVRECQALLGETPTRFAARGMPKRSSVPAASATD